MSTELYSESAVTCTKCHASTHHYTQTTDGQVWCEGCLDLVLDGEAGAHPATPAELESARGSLADLVEGLPLEYLLDAMWQVEGRLTDREDLPEVAVTDEGLECPWVGCDGTAVEEVDTATRTNRAEFALGEFGKRLLCVAQVDEPEWATTAWRCAKCQRPVSIPTGTIEVRWS